MLSFFEMLVYYKHKMIHYMFKHNTVHLISYLLLIFKFWPFYSFLRMFLLLKHLTKIRMLTYLFEVVKTKYSSLSLMDN